MSKDNFDVPYFIDCLRHALGLSPIPNSSYQRPKIDSHLAWGAAAIGDGNRHVGNRILSSKI